MNILSFSDPGIFFWANVLSWLDIHSIVSCRLVCHAWNNGLKEERSWSEMMAQRDIKGMNGLDALMVYHYLNTSWNKLDLSNKPQPDWEMLGGAIWLGNPIVSPDQSDCLHLLNVTERYKYNPKRCYYLNQEGVPVLAGPSAESQLKMLVFIGGKGLWGGPLPTRKGLKAKGIDVSGLKFLPQVEKSDYIPTPDHVLKVWQNCSGLKMSITDEGRGREYIQDLSSWMGKFSPLQIAAVRMGKQLALSITTRNRMWVGIIGDTCCYIPTVFNNKWGKLALNNPQFGVSGDRAFLKIESTSSPLTRAVYQMPIPYAKRKNLEGDLEGVKSRKIKEGFHTEEG